MRPSENKEEWFNILVIHQNRFKGFFVGANKRDSIVEGLIPPFIDLVIWGHEHESIP